MSLEAALSRLADALETHAGAVRALIEVYHEHRTTTASATAPGPAANPAPPKTPPAASAPATTAPEWTLERTRKRLAELSRAGKTEQIKALVAEYGAPKLPDIDPAKYPEIVQRAEAL